MLLDEFGGDPPPVLSLLKVSPKAWPTPANHLFWFCSQQTNSFVVGVRILQKGSRQNVGFLDRGKMLLVAFPF